MNGAPTRDLNIDAARGLGLALMIYSHFIVYVDPAAIEFVGRQWQAGAAWRMPFLFFVSGLANSRLGGKDFRSVARVSLGLFLTALVVNTVGLALFLPVSSMDFDHAVTLLTAPVMGFGYQLVPLWFLTALAVVRLVAWGVLRAPPGLQRGALVAATAAALYVGFGQNATELWQLQALPGAFAFFMLGQAWTGGSRGRLIWLAPLALLTPMLNGGCATDPLAACDNLVRGDLPFFTVSLVHGDYGYAPLFALSGLAGCLMLWRAVNLLPDRSLPKRALAHWGRHALDVLLVHSFAKFFFERLVATPFDGVGLPQALGWCVLTAIVTVPAHEAARRAAEPTLRRMHDAILDVAAMAIRTPTRDRPSDALPLSASAAP